MTRAAKIVLDFVARLRRTHHCLELFCSWRLNVYVWIYCERTEENNCSDWNRL